MRYDVNSIKNLENNLKSDGVQEDLIYIEMGLLMDEFAILQVSFLILKERTPEQLQRIFLGRNDLKLVLDTIQNL
jgi:hypothetical protein